MMKTVVSKFGGTSLADAGRLVSTGRLIASRAPRQYIVLSAPGKRAPGDEKITDLLCRAHARLASGCESCDETRVVLDRFRAIIRSLLPAEDPDILLSTLVPNARISLHSAAAQGEYFCALLFARYTGIPFIDASALIRFDAFGNLLWDETRASVQRMAASHARAVIPGFYGSRPDGSVMTFPRGGSDITGALIAAALNADVYENWTDVDGLMSADPALCPDAVCHPAVSYRQMQWLSRAGAGVLHPGCLEPVRNAGIPTRLLNSFAPDSPGTLISDDCQAIVPCVCARDGYFALPDRGDEIAPDLPGEPTPTGFQSPDGSRFLLLRNACEGAVPVSLISVFGMPPALFSQAERISGSIASRQDHVCAGFVTPRERSVTAVRRLHDLLPLSERQGSSGGTNLPD